MTRSKHTKIELSDAEAIRSRVAQLDVARKEQLAGRLRYERELRRTTWECEQKLCSGQPHPDCPTPHARAGQRLPFKSDDGLLGALWMAGRGFGKTRVGAEGIRKLVTRKRNPYGRIALVGRTAADVRDVMVEGESGLLAVFPKWERPEYQPSKRRVVFANGAIATCYSAEKPDQLRGPQHDLLWGDEVSTWPKMLDLRQETGRPGPEGVLTNAFLGLRLGDAPRAILTGTPRPTKDMRYLVNMKRIKVISGTTYDNLRNLAPMFREVILEQYEGTRTGRQELNGELLEDVEGSLLKHYHFDHADFRPFAPQTTLSKVVVAVDPNVATSTKSNWTGIVVCASDAERRYGYVLHSERFKGSPAESMTRAIHLSDQFGANYLVAEANNGGDYVVEVARQVRPDIRVKKVHASVGKTARAEPVSSFYEQYRIRHIGDPAMHAALEDEWTSWVPSDPDADSPDVLDACVWGFTDLMVGRQRVIPGYQAGA